jgi:hypothetical protein
MKFRRYVRLTEIFLTSTRDAKSQGAFSMSEDLPCDEVGVACPTSKQGVQGPSVLGDREQDSDLVLVEVLQAAYVRFLLR